MTLRELRGIQAGTSPVQRDTSLLEDVLSAEQKIMKEITKPHEISVGVPSIIPSISLPLLSTDLLQQYITYGLDVTLPDVQANIRGFLSGELLYRLAKQKEKNDDKTPIVIDGAGKRYDYLFTRVDFTGSLIVKNVVAKELCSIGRNGNGVSQILAYHIRADSAFNAHDSRVSIVITNSEIKKILSLIRCPNSAMGMYNIDSGEIINVNAFDRGPKVFGENIDAKAFGPYRGIINPTARRLQQQPSLVHATELLRTIDQHAPDKAWKMYKEIMEIVGDL